MTEKKGYAGCEICGKELLLFKCKYCGKAFCEHHKAPEMHECAGLEDYRRLQSMGVIAKPGGTAASAERTDPLAAARRPRIATLYKRSVYTIKVLSVVAVILAAIFTLILLISYINANIPAGPYKIPVSNATGASVVLINNKTATDPTWDSLMAFLKADDTIKIKYDFPRFTCADFARTLHDKAEASGIRCGFIAVEFENRTIDYSIYDNGNGNFHPPTRSPDTGHGLNVFKTVDRGLVYVDASSDTDYIGSDAKVRLAYLAEGQELNEIDLDWATNTSYSFYESYKRTQLDFIADQRAFYKDLADYNLRLSDNGYVLIPDLKNESDRLNSRAVELNARKSRIGPFYYPIGIVKKIETPYW
jgi:hypothetical protein